jgi:hypothetical protein
VALCLARVLIFSMFTLPSLNGLAATLHEVIVKALLAAPSKFPLSSPTLGLITWCRRVISVLLGQGNVFLAAKWVWSGMGDPCFLHSPASHT